MKQSKIDSDVNFNFIRKNVRPLLMKFRNTSIIGPTKIDTLYLNILYCALFFGQFCIYKEASKKGLASLRFLKQIYHFS